jgi:predicted nucleotidyltransferase
VSPQPLRLRLLLERLRDADVDFVLVGGLAVNAWGYLRATRDIDLVPDPSSENLARLDALLVKQGLPQIPSFSALDARAAEVDIDGLRVKVCSLEDLLAMKRASGRSRDREDLEALEAGREGDGRADL